MKSRAVALGGLALVVAAAAGCATAREVDDLRKRQGIAETKITNIERTPLADRPRTFYMGEGYDVELGQLIEAVASQYRDKKYADDVRRHANSVELVPVPMTNTYFVRPGWDNGNRRRDELADRTLPDRDGTRLVPGYIISGDKIPKVFLDRMLGGVPRPLVPQYRR